MSNRTATHCNTSATHSLMHTSQPELILALLVWIYSEILVESHCNTLPHTATHLQLMMHTPKPELILVLMYMEILLESHKNCEGQPCLFTNASEPCPVYPHIRAATHSNICNSLQHTVTHCNTLHHRLSLHIHTEVDVYM